MPDIEIRNWRQGDDEALVPLWAPMRWTDLELYGRKFEDPSNAPDRVFVAEIDGRIAGHAIATRRDVYLEGAWRTFGGVGHLAVHPKAKGLGLGRRLLDECDRVAEEAGLRGVLMWTKESFIPAYAMYLRTGYELVGQMARHQTALDWLIEALPAESLEVRPVVPASDDVLQLRAEWAEEAFPVSCGWDVQAMTGTEWGLYDGGKLVGAFSAQLTDPVVPAQRAAEALGAMARWKRDQGAEVADFWLTAESPADRALAPHTHLREVIGMRTLVKPLGGALKLGDQYAIHGACWPW
jgi:GNAT superfamily N-acetyltransferase